MWLTAFAEPALQPIYWDWKLPEDSLRGCCRERRRQNNYCTQKVLYDGMRSTFPTAADFWRRHRLRCEWSDYFEGFCRETEDTKILGRHLPWSWLFRQSHLTLAAVAGSRQKSASSRETPDYYSVTYRQDTHTDRELEQPSFLLSPLSRLTDVGCLRGVGTCHRQSVISCWNQGRWRERRHSISTPWYQGSKNSTNISSFLIPLPPP